MAMIVGGEAIKFAGNHKSGLMKTAASVLLVTAAGGLGFVHAMRGAVETGVAISGGKGTLDEVFVMPPQECHGGHKATVRGARAEINKKLWGIPTTYRASETYNGQITAQVCNTGVAGKQIVNKKTHHVTIKIPESSLTTMVFPTDPANKNAFTSDNGAAMAIWKNVANDVKILPGGIDMKGPDQLANKLRGWALLGAYATTSEACGKTAWPHLKPLYENEIKKDAVANSNKYNPEHPIGLEDVTVELPENVELENQYGNQLSGIEDELSRGGVHVTRVDRNALVCTPSASLKITGAS